jgi:hypothetical protein
MSEKKTERVEEVKASPTISMLLYGTAGSGKSIFASTFPKPLILDFDNGHKIYEAQGLFPEAVYVHGKNTLVALAKAVKQIEDGENKFDTLVIDSLTNLENEAVADMRGYSTMSLADTLYTNRGKKLGYDEWGNISGSSIALMTKLRQYPVNVVIITQVADTFDDGRKLMYPELVGKGKNESTHFADYTVFMEKIDGDSGVTRLAHMTSTSADKFVAKSRGLGDPRPIKNPSYEKLAKLIQDSKPKLDFGD